MFSRGQRGIYDRFRGRIIWPIRGIGGETIGFGARKLFEDDQGPKYLNTPETQLYKKSQVLYGLDIAKRNIAKKKQIVVVEGYTDVMAAHLAGIDTAVATCGTAFGTDHIKIVRRLLGDDGTGGEVIFTFDGDAAGQKAALSAFKEDQRFTAQTFVAVAKDGMDPCDLRLARGDSAVRALIASRTPLFEFAIQATMRNYNLETLEGRVQAMRAIAPILAGIRDNTLRPAYIRQASGWLGLNTDEIQRAVNHAARTPQTDPYSTPTENTQPTHTPTHQDAAPTPTHADYTQPDPSDPNARMEKEALEAIIQLPNYLTTEQWHEFAKVHFRYRTHAAIAEGITGAAATTIPTPGADWINAIRTNAPDAVHPLIAELTVTPIPASTPEQIARYIHDILNRLFQQEINHRKSELLIQLQNLNPTTDPQNFRTIQQELLNLEIRRRSLMSN